MSTIDQIDKAIKDGGNNDSKRDKYLATLKASPEFQKYVVAPLRESIEEVKSVSSVDMTQSNEKIIATLEAQKISYEFLRLAFSIIFK